MEQFHETILQPPPGKIVGRNFNGTVVVTSSPNNEAELQLYRVLQRASLLAYYDTLLEMGGDDVQQLCEAGEEEFLEIMALVGMASKPLHVRRLQKALQEWITNPALFRAPLVGGGSLSPRPPVAPPSPAPSHHPPRKETPPLPPHSPTPIMEMSCCVSPGPSPGSPMSGPPVLVEAQVQRLADSALHLVNNLPHLEPKNNVKRKLPKDFEQVMALSEDDPKRMDLIRKYAAIYGRFDCKRKPEKPLTLHEVSVNEAAAQICRLIPALLTRRDELFPLARQVVRDSGYHYSKGHSKSFYRPPSLNGDQPPYKRPRSEGSDSEETLRKRQERLDQIADELRSVNEKTENLIGKENSASEVEALHNRHQQLLQEQSQIVNRGLQQHRMYRRNSNGKLSCLDPERPDTDDTDSPFSYSNTSSPLHDINDSRDSLCRDGDTSLQSPAAHQNGESEDEGLNDKDSKSDSSSLLKDRDSCDESFYQEKVKVIASSGGNIIAVANPALSMSPAVEARTALISSDPLEQKST